LRILWHQSLGGGDFRALLFTSALASAAAIGLVYGPVLFAVRRRLASPPWWIFPLVSILIGLLPVVLIVLFWGGNLGSLSSPEAMMFYIMFAVFGAVFGGGFYLAYVRKAP
ncbi:MAG TPA: hypothetical protein VJU15_00515, partial [Gemmatimonadales bacterium]|nr:hypothetical protein [Gemmatimonadales bacterium]